MDRLTKYSNDLIRNKAVNILRKLDSENGLDGDELAFISSFCLIERAENKELKKYEDLEEQGKLLKLLKLPCAVGDTVYRVHKGTKLSPDRTYECRVVGVKQEYNTFSVKLYTNINEETYSIWIDDWFDRCQIGYEFFLTREEAEAALKELERGKGE